SSMHSHPPESPLFPYTTLFRSVLRLHYRSTSDDKTTERSSVLRPAARVAGSKLRFAMSDRDNQDLHDHQSGDRCRPLPGVRPGLDRKSTRLNSSHVKISYAVFC